MILTFRPGLRLYIILLHVACLYIIPVQFTLVSRFQLLSLFISAPSQKEMPKVIRQGFEEMLLFEKTMEEKKRVYTYEKAVER